MGEAGNVHVEDVRSAMNESEERETTPLCQQRNRQTKVQRLDSEEDSVLSDHDPDHDSFDSRISLESEASSASSHVSIKSNQSNGHIVNFEDILVFPECVFEEDRRPRTKRKRDRDATLRQSGFKRLMIPLNISRYIRIWQSPNYSIRFVLLI